MSAIFGLLNRDHRPIDPGDLDRMNAALVSLGTDGDGKWGHGHVALGQRLMRFTPDDRFERQPLVSADGQHVLVCDGRIDNRPELMDELAISPAMAREMPDSEFLLRAFEKWGEDCLQHVIGFFAFALWSFRDRYLLLARSPIGAPALFYHATRRAFAFATMPKGLFALPSVPRALNDQRLADFLAKLGGEPPTTFFRDINLLPTGHLLSLGAGGLHTRRYWQPDGERQIRFPRQDDYVEAFCEKLGRVVADHLRSLTPVGIMMSGGLDSTSVAATAAALLNREGRRLAAFTEVPRRGFEGPLPQGRYGDETPLVQAVSRMYDNLDLTLIHTDGQTFLDDLDALFFHLEAPYRNTANRVWAEAIFQEAKRRGMRVLLDGGQGNLTVSRNGSGLLPQLLRKGRWARALHEARAMARWGSASSAGRALLGQGVLPLLPDPLAHRIRWLCGKPETASWRTCSAIHPDFAAVERVEERFHERERDRKKRSRANNLHPHWDALCKQDFGAYAGPFRAKFGVDLRSPLADLRIAGFCLALPEDQCLCKGEPRSLVRRAMAGRLPAGVLTNRKRGLQAADWFERLTAARGQIASELKRLERCESAQRVLDLSRMRRLVEHWPQASWDRAPVVNEYGLCLQQGLMVGRFLRWFEAGG